MHLASSSQTKNAYKTCRISYFDYIFPETETHQFMQQITQYTTLFTPVLFFFTGIADCNTPQQIHREEKTSG